MGLPAHWIESFEYVTPDGITFSMQAGMRATLTFEGFGIPPVEYITQQGPFQHGSTVYDYRAQERIIQIMLRENGCSRQEYWDNRMVWIDHLRYNRQYLNSFQPGTLIVRKPDASQWAIKCLITDGPGFSPRSLDQWDEWGLTETLRFICHDPIWYDPVSICVTIGTSEVFDELIFYNPVTGASYDSINFRNETLNPTGEDLIFGSNLISNQSNITYTGTWMTFPNIAIYGPIASPTIANVTTGEAITLNYSVIAGETVTIYLQYGNKWVHSNIQGDITGIVTDDSEFSTFHLEPNPGAAGGINTIQVSGGDSLVGLTRVDLLYYTRYIGI